MGKEALDRVKRKLLVEYGGANGKFLLQLTRYLDKEASFDLVTC